MPTPYGSRYSGGGGSSGGGGVTSFNTRTGDVTLTAGDVESTLTANNFVFVGTGSGTGTEKVLPGTILASHQYAPSVAATYVVANQTLTLQDATNLTLALTVPANGIVDIDVTLYWIVSAAASVTTYAWIGLLNHTGGAQVGDTINLFEESSSIALLFQTTSTFRFHLTVLTPGALQLDLAAAFLGVGSTVELQAQGAQGAATGTVSPFLMQAIASV